MTIKNIFYGALACAMLTGTLASCTDDTLGDLTGDGTVTFTATLADAPDTRALLGDGTSANLLKYAVYDSNGNLVINSSTKVSGYQASVTLQLAAGKAYDIVFFAQRDVSTVYTFDAENKNVNIDYTQMSGSMSSYKYDDDCFYEVRKGYVAGSSSQENVTLTRPVALVTFATNDLDSEIVNKAYGRYVYSSISTTAYTQMDLLSGLPTGEEQEISIPSDARLKQANSGFRWMATHI